MLIIFGSSNRRRVLDEGTFFCPKCQAQRSYKHQKATRYFSLYFIPLIPMGDLGEYVECQTCGTAFEPRVLTMPPQRIQAGAGSAGQPDLVRLINSIPQHLNEGKPVEYVLRDLTAAGLDRDAALGLVNPHLAEGTRTCERCGLSYAASVSRCAECGGPLS